MYGAELYIEQCARSLFSQSYPNCEFIFVDDASKDRSLVALKCVVSEYPHLSQQIKIVEKAENGGVAAARNAALDAATGDYILFVDADDWVDPEIVEKLIIRSVETNADICNAWCRSVDSLDRMVNTPERWIGSPCTHLRAVLGQSHIVPNHVRGMLFRRSLFNANGLRFTARVDFGEDYSLLPQLIYFAKSLSTLRSYLYYYRVENQGSYMNNIGGRHIRNYVEAQAIVSRFVESRPDGARYRRSLVLGRVNIKKWIFKRGATPRDFDAALFGEEPPKIRYPILWLYNSVVNLGNPMLVKIFSIVVNLPLYLRKKL